MTTIPKEPDNIIWTGMEMFGDCKYVYVRFEDHTISSNAPAEVIQMMDEMRAITERSPKGQGRYALNVKPWLAEVLYNCANCELFGVMTTGANMRGQRSKYYSRKREAAAGV